MAEESITRGDLEALRSELKEDHAATRLEVAQLRTEISDRFGAVQGEFGVLRAELNERFGVIQSEIADTRKELAVLQVDVRKDITQLHTGMERLERTNDQWRQEIRQDLQSVRQEMQQWRLSTTRQLWTMVGVTGGAFTVILAAVIKLVFFPGP